MTPSTTRAGEVANNASSDDFTGFDVHRLDCAVDALRGADLTPYRQEMRRIQDNLNDLMEVER